MFSIMPPLTFDTYTGVFEYLWNLFISYLNLTGPASAMALIAGAIATILCLVIVIIKPKQRSYIPYIIILSLLPLAIGAIGTIFNVHEITNVASIERNLGMDISAFKYLRTEAGLNRPILYLFPMIMGVLGSIVPVTILVIMAILNITNYAWRG